MKTFIKVGGLLLVALFVLSGCEEKTVVQNKKVTILPKKSIKQSEIANNTLKDNNAKAIKINKNYDLSSFAKDNAKISSNGKYTLIVFTSKTSEYCDKLKEDILGNKEIKDRLANDFTTYFLDADQNKMHQLEHQGSVTNVDTKTLLDIYGIQATPTLIFTDKQAKSIFIVPGYMDQKQFKVTLDFVESKKWVGVSRKTGDVYKALKNYYIKKGIIEPQ